MFRRHLIVFSVLVALAILPLLLQEQTKLVVSTKLSSVLLYPMTVMSELVEFLSVSRARIEELETMNSRLRLENAALRERIPQDTTPFREKKFKLLKARVVGRDPSNINGYLYIDKGSKDKLYLNQPVITIDGLVGKVAFVDTYYSIIETLENAGFAISGLHLKTGVHGIVKQRGSLHFDYVRIHDEITTGDSIHTSGMSEIFPKGILIGTVHGVQQIEDLFFKAVYLTPSVRVNRLTSVYLIVGEPTVKKLELREVSR